VNRERCIWCGGVALHHISLGRSLVNVNVLDPDGCMTQYFRMGLCGPERIVASKPGASLK
jgi:hypothetical protein